MCVRVCVYREERITAGFLEYLLNYIQTEQSQETRSAGNIPFINHAVMNEMPNRSKCTGVSQVIRKIELLQLITVLNYIIY